MRVYDCKIHLKCDVNDGGQVCCEGNYDNRREQKVPKNCKKNTTFEKTLADKNCMTVRESTIILALHAVINLVRYP